MIRSNNPENLRHVCIVINFNPIILLYCSDDIDDDNCSNCWAGNCIDDAVLDSVVDAVAAVVVVVVVLLYMFDCCCMIDSALCTP